MSRHRGNRAAASVAEQVADLVEVAVEAPPTAGWHFCAVACESMSGYDGMIIISMLPADNISERLVDLKEAMNKLKADNLRYWAKSHRTELEKAAHALLTKGPTASYQRKIVEHDETLRIDCGWCYASSPELRLIQEHLCMNAFQSSATRQSKSFSWTAQPARQRK